MVNQKGICSYCQDCGACSASTLSSMRTLNDQVMQMIADEVIRAIDGPESTSHPLIPLGVSNRHIHLTESTFHHLYGDDDQFEKYKDLYQPGEFAAKQSLTIAGPKMRILQNVRILGPLRSYNQVEISLTDAIYLGIKPPIRNSGDLEDAAPITLIGPKGSVYIEKCAIIANRHLHLPSVEANKLNIEHGNVCKVRIGGEKGTLFENVLVRVNDNWRPQLHLDTDDANAANVRCQMHVEFYGMM